MNPPVRISILPIAALIGCAVTVGCANQARGPYQPATSETRDTALAQRRSQEAVAAMDSNPQRAEKLLKDALTADLFYGPAHNNLGVLYLKQGKLYEASGEFEWARKLMPGHPDPRLNLGLVLEEAGRIDDALSTYSSVLAIRAGDIAAMQALASLQLRSDTTDDRTPKFLYEISMRGESELWRDWARRQLLR